MRSNNDDKHLVENIGNEPIVLSGFEAYSYLIPKTSNK